MDRTKWVKFGWAVNYSLYQFTVVGRRIYKDQSIQYKTSAATATPARVLFAYTLLHYITILHTCTTSGYK